MDIEQIHEIKMNKRRKLIIFDTSLTSFEKGYNIGIVNSIIKLFSNLVLKDYLHIYTNNMNFIRIVLQNFYINEQ